ncbi:MAG: hypothetical protein H6R46_233 [Proteobacteria bacterium]|jgi:hypothetical protein|nr:hypothetical protein [Pseudomonadota bacterium]MBS1246796.1 hypothetical protein [Pseudomonadota bacterium]
MQIVKQAFLRIGFTVVLIAVLGIGGWTWFALTYDYSDGERAGYVQKLSRKGWICKTWEGELALVNLPGAMPEIFYFSVRDDAVAKRIQQSVGKRVALSYEQHIGIPTTCFGETEYFVVNIKDVE